MSATLVGLAVVAGLTVLVPAPPASAAVWLPETEATADPADEIREIATATAPDGSFVIAWAELLAGGTTPGWSVQVATRAPGATGFSAPVVAAPPGSHVSSVVLVVDGTGATTVAWVRRWGIGQSRVEAARWRAGSAGFAAPVDVGGLTDGHGYVVGGGDQQGRVTLAWTRRESVDGDLLDRIETTTWEPDQSGWSGRQALGTGDAYSAVLAVDGVGAVTVAWLESPSPDPEARVRSRTRLAGSSSFEPVHSHTPIGDQAGPPELSSNATGGTVLLWSIRGTSDPRLQVAVRPPGAASFGAPVDVARTASFQAPKVAIDDAGTVTVAWAAGKPEAGIWVATGPAGGAFAPRVLVDSRADGTDTVSLSSAAGGAAILVWIPAPSIVQGGIGSVRAAYRPAGGMFGATIDLTAPVEGDFIDAATAVDHAGDAFVGWARRGPSTAGFRSRVFARILDGTAPALQGVSVPPTGAAGASVAMSSSATDSWSGPPSVSWDFGDGSSGAGGSTSHVYAATGTYLVRVTATDGAGNTTSRARTIVVADATAPVLSAARLKPGRLPTGHGARLSVTSSERAALSGLVQRKRDGRWRPVGTKRWSVQAGANTKSFYGKTSERRLRSGTYRVRLVATDPAGNTSATTTIRFRVERG